MTDRHNAISATPHIPDGILHATNAQKAAEVSAPHEHIKYSRLWRCLRQSAPENAASVKDAPAFIEQMTVIKLIGTRQLPLTPPTSDFLRRSFRKTTCVPSEFCPNLRGPQGPALPRVRSFGRVSVQSGGAFKIFAASELRIQRACLTTA